MNQLKKKRSLFSIISNNEEFQLILTIIGACVWPVGTYWLGKLCLYLEIKIFNMPSDFSFVDCIVTGFIMEVILVLILVLMEFIIDCITSLIEAIKIAKIIQHLPVSVEEIKMLNIDSYELFEDFLINLFTSSPKNITIGTYNMAEHAIFETIIEYLKFDDTVICNISSDKNDDPKTDFAKLHSEAIAKRLFNSEKIKGELPTT